jgi:hypothetical protein
MRNERHANMELAAKSPDPSEQGSGGPGHSRPRLPGAREAQGEG